MGQCYTFNSGANGAELLTTPKGGAGNGLEVMLDVQEDEYLPMWKDVGMGAHVWWLEWGTQGSRKALGRRGAGAGWDLKQSFLVRRGWAGLVHHHPGGEGAAAGELPGCRPRSPFPHRGDTVRGGNPSADPQPGGAAHH